jgi:hypothetical protein
MGIERRGLQFFMSKQHLDGADIFPLFEQMGGGQRLRLRHGRLNTVGDEDNLLVDYRIEPEDPTRTIPNPERRALDKQIRTARVDLAKIEREYGAAAADNTEQRRPTMRGFKIAYGKLGKTLRAARARLARLIDMLRDNQDDTRDNQDGKFLIGRFPKLLARI